MTGHGSGCCLNAASERRRRGRTLHEPGPRLLLRILNRPLVVCCR